MTLMKAFEWSTPGTVDEAVKTLAQCRETRDAVLELIAATILPQLIASTVRKTG